MIHCRMRFVDGEEHVFHRRELLSCKVVLYLLTISSPAFFSLVYVLEGEEGIPLTILL